LSCIEWEKSPPGGGPVTDKSVLSRKLEFHKNNSRRHQTQRRRQYLGTVERLIFVIDDPPCRFSKGTVANVSHPLSRGSQELRQWRTDEKELCLSKYVPPVAAIIK